MGQIEKYLISSLSVLQGPALCTRFSRLSKRKPGNLAKFFQNFGSIFVRGFKKILDLDLFKTCCVNLTVPWRLAAVGFLASRFNFPFFFEEPLSSCNRIYCA